MNRAESLRAEIEAMFADLSGYADLEDAYMRAHSRQNQQERERRKFKPNGGKVRRPAKPSATWLDRMRAWVATLSVEQLRDIHRRNWLKRKADPVRYGAKKKQNAERMNRQYHALPPAERKARNRRKYQDIRASPERLAKHQAYNREQMRRYRAERRAA